MRFEEYNISPEIKKNLSKLSFKRPTDIQFKSIPSILKGEDVLAIAQTGTGKTAAFAIPVINMIDEKKRIKRPDGIKCLVMVPTHELAIQLMEVFTKLSRHTRVTTYGIYGGVDQDPQIEKLNKGVDILIATPGRMFDLRSQGHLILDRVEILILDEADHMLDLGFIGDIQDLMRHLPKKRQTLFFSATINQKIKKLAYSLVTNAIRIQISPKNPVAKNVNHKVIFVSMDDKRFFLERIVNENSESKILVFVRTKVRAERVKKAMGRVAIESITIHGDKDQRDRNLVMNQFKSGEVKLLIATDVSARGIDIPDVDIVINYDLPDKDENYVHRVGRTGRGKNKGNAYSFCSKEEEEMLLDIQEFLGEKIEVLDIGKKEYFETIDFSNDTSGDIKSMLKEIEEHEKGRRKKNKKKKR
ncbi:MAG: DEAD/DEAH box helicase [Saprospiraceae bacterium]|jgi:ATP-dependent RNA helicase RhlE|nr:DEAD/DEAH box helicase [Saprospiraceae bacterium]MDG1435333.1 DEAD/DEAH box helicase [Saprospiraceae bacterium]MDG2417754.1 DEAD/DEAH box helicase [Saprospiraceae bacterium]